MTASNVESRKVALAILLSASVTALLALALWTGLLDLSLDDSTTRMLAALLAVVFLSELALAGVFYVRSGARR